MIADRLGKLERKLAKEFHVFNRVELSRGALLHNFDLFQMMHAKGHMIPVLKSNAYGHGLEQIVEILEERDFPYVAVDGYFEALKIRSISKRPVLIMGSIDPRNFKNMRYEDFTFVVQDEQAIRALGRVRKKIKVHLEINTGMNRQGVSMEELDDYLTLIGSLRSLKLEGLMTHLADADGRTERHTEAQIDLFDSAVERAKSLGLSPRYLHVANSAGTVSAKSKYANSYRVGLGLYGVSPFPEHDRRNRSLKELRPVLALKSKISRVNELKKGDRVSYNGIFVAPKDIRIGVLPLGYYEGVRRALSNRGVVKWDRVFLPIVGRVCMNHTMINLEGVPAGSGDDVIVISADPEDKNSLENICREFNLFSYEVLVNIAPTIRRVIVP